MLFKFKNGFTMIELVITVAILAITTSIALPYFHDFRAKQEVKKISSLLSSTIQSAKSHAAIQHSNVVICPISNQQSCENSNWNTGFILFVDNNKNRQVDLDEKIIATEFMDLKYGNLNWRGTLSLPSLTFQASSGLPNGSNGSFFYCSTHQLAHHRVVLSRMGHIRVENPAIC